MTKDEVKIDKKKALSFKTALPENIIN